MDAHALDSIPSLNPSPPGIVEVGARASRGRRWWPWGLACSVVLVALYVLFPRPTEGQAKTIGQSAAARSVPVVAAPARTGDMGVYLTGIGRPRR